MRKKDENIIASADTKDALIAKLEEATGKPTTEDQKDAINSCAVNEAVLSISLMPDDGYLSVKYSTIIGPEADARMRVVLALVQALAQRALNQMLGAQSEDVPEPPTSNQLH